PPLLSFSRPKVHCHGPNGGLSLAETHAENTDYPYLECNQHDTRYQNILHYSHPSLNVSSALTLSRSRAAPPSSSPPPSPPPPTLSLSLLPSLSCSPSPSVVLRLYIGVCV